MKDLVIVGAGGFGRELLEIVKNINSVNPTWNVLGFIDDNTEALDDKRCEYKIIGKISDWKVEEGQYFAMAIAKPAVKEKVAKSLLDRGAEFASIIHPNTRISESAKYGKGLVMYESSALGPDTELGDFVTLLSTGIGHDAVIGDYSTISSHCGINGYVRLGKRAYVGSHACIVPSVRIGDDATVGIGSVVVRNVKAGTTVFGNPAKKLW